MIKVSIPDICQPEIKYTIDCLLGAFLGLNYEISVQAGQKNVVFNVGKKKITIKNYFFHFNNTKILYNQNTIPITTNSGVISTDSQFHKITSLFGTSSLTKEGDSFLLEADIISSTFFMLARWEEQINSVRDKHNRFPGSASLAHKEGFLERPIVNEYIELLWSLLKSIGCQQIRKERNFKIVPTHDVDVPYLWWGKKEKYKYFLSRAYRCQTKEFFNNLKLGFDNKDPYDTYDKFMNLSEKAGVKSNFFFMTGGNSRYDNFYSINHPRVIKLIQHIRNRGHNIGLHPSYNSYNSLVLLRQEKETLEKIINDKIFIGRQHYLRFEAPTTWRLWEELGMEWDSTLSYADYCGYRCGVCYPFPVYDFLGRKQLNLIERPLILMEGSIINYEKLSPTEGIEKVVKLKKLTKKYSGEFIFLWHNSAFNNEQFMGYEDMLNAMYR